jgi:hypothetical protein
MAGKLLILSFHGASGPGVKTSLLDEDLLFKKAAIDKGLITGDVMDEPSAQARLDPSLFEDRKAGPASGLEKGSLPSSSVSLVGLNKLGANAWTRAPFQKRPDPGHPGQQLPSLFHLWLDQVLKIPVDVLVLAGHHQESVVWGSEDARTGGHRWYSALRPRIATDGAGHQRALLEIRGHGLKPDEKDEDVVRAGPFDVSAALGNCRLLVILGCNGATEMVRDLRDWITIAAGKPPFILGWYGIHSFPTDQNKEHFSDQFWSRLKALAPGTDLAFLHDSARAEAIAGAWAGAMKDAFAGSKTQRHLLFSDTAKRGRRGAGAIDPSGGMWRVVDSQGTMKKVGQMPTG